MKPRFRVTLDLEYEDCEEDDALKGDIDELKAHLEKVFTTEPLNLSTEAIWHRGATTRVEALHLDPKCARADKVEHPRYATDKDVERVFREFWRGVLLGEVSTEELVREVDAIPLSVKRELFDFHGIIQNVPKVYMEVTGGMVSKPNTWASEVIGMYEEHVNKIVAEAIEDFKREHGIDQDFPDEEAMPPPADHASHQPPPLPGRADVLEALIEDYKVRAEAGLKKYGTRLQTFNGRNAIIDALQEAMDLSLYLKQFLMEEESKGEPK